MGGWVGARGGGFIISTLRPCITFMEKRREENTHTCSSFNPALAQAPCLQAEHSMKSSCLFLIFLGKKSYLILFCKQLLTASKLVGNAFAHMGFLTKWTINFKTV